jgi:hypothetical protein
MGLGGGIRERNNKPEAIVAGFLRPSSPIRHTRIRKFRIAL